MSCNGAIPGRSLVQVSLSVPAWDWLTADPRRFTVDRSPGCSQIPWSFPVRAARSPATHLAGALGSRQRLAGDVILLHVEPGVNIGTPAFLSGRRKPIMASVGEPLHSWDYFGLYLARGCAAPCLGPIRFSSDRVEAIDSRSRQIDFALAGVPLLAGGHQLSLEAIVGRCYDMRHLFVLLFEDWQRKRWPAVVPKYRKLHDKLMAEWLKRIDANPEERGRQVLAIAREAGVDYSQYQ